MDEAEAIRLAMPVMKTHPLSYSVDYAKPKALYIDGVESTKELRQRWAHIDFTCPRESHWLVLFPLFESDPLDGREFITIHVSPSTKIAEIVLDL